MLRGILHQEPSWWRWFNFLFQAPNPVSIRKWIAENSLANNHLQPSFGRQTRSNQPFGSHLLVHKMLETMKPRPTWNASPCNHSAMGPWVILIGLFPRDPYRIPITQTNHGEMSIAACYLQLSTFYSTQAYLIFKKSSTGPTERTPKHEYLIARSRLTERGPLVRSSNKITTHPDIAHPIGNPPKRPLWKESRLTGCW